MVLNKSLINKSKQALKEIPFSKITVELYHFNLTYIVRLINFKVEMVLFAGVVLRNFISFVNFVFIGAKMLYFIFLL